MATLEQRARGEFGGGAIGMAAQPKRKQVAPESASAIYQNSFLTKLFNKPPVDVVQTPKQPGAAKKRVPGQKAGTNTGAMLAGGPRARADNFATRAFDRTINGPLSKQTLDLNRRNPTAQGALIEEAQPALGVVDNFNVPQGARILGGGRVSRDVGEAPLNTLRGFAGGQDTIFNASPSNTDLYNRAGLQRDENGNPIGLLGNAEKNYAGRTALEETGRALDITRAMIDERDARNAAERASVGNRIAVIKNSGIGGPQSLQDQAAEQARILSDPFSSLAEKNAAYRGGAAFDSLIGRENTAQGNQLYADAGIDRAQIAANQRSDEFAAEAALNASTRAAQLKKIRAEAFDRVTGPVQELAKSLIEKGDEEAAFQLLQNVGAIQPEDLEGVNTQEYAEGGLVDPMQQYAGGGVVDPTMSRNMGGAMGGFAPQQPDMALIQRYQDYSSKAMDMNLPVMGFSEFQNMSSPSPQGGGVQGYAEGGMVDVSGKTVMDSDPNAPTDSIPAVIDGQTPAALDSGEFVIPKDVVQFYGTDKLSKMIEKARNPDGQNGAKNSAISQFGGAGPSNIG